MSVENVFFEVDLGVNVQVGLPPVGTKFAVFPERELPYVFIYNACGDIYILDKDVGGMLFGMSDKISLAQLWRAVDSGQNNYILVEETSFGKGQGWKNLMEPVIKDGSSHWVERIQSSNPFAMEIKYEIREALPANYDWPEVDMLTLVRTAFAFRNIDSLKHPIAHQLYHYDNG